MGPGIPENDKHPYYRSGYFRFVGQLIGMSVLHSGIGIVGLSRALTTYMVTEDVELAGCNRSIDDVLDYCVQQALTCTVRQVTFLCETS